MMKTIVVAIAALMTLSGCSVDPYNVGDEHVLCKDVRVIK